MNTFWFFLIWCFCGAIGSFLMAWIDWYEGEDIYVESLVLYFLFFFFGPLGLIVVVLSWLSSSSFPLIKGRKKK
jgi:hypothetical protein